MGIGNTKKKRIKPIYLIGGGIFIIVLLLFIFSKGEDIPSVYVTTPTKKSITEHVPANGRIRPVLEVNIAPDVSGEIVELNCKEGDYVKNGEVLIKIKPDVYTSILDQATAILNSAKARYKEQEAKLTQASLTYNRKKKLFDAKAITQSEYEIAKAEYQIAQNALEAAEYDIQSAKASVREAKENLSKTIIYSPMDGIISRVKVEKGERVVGTSQMAGTDMISIADFSMMEVVVDVNEKDIPKVEMGDTAIIEVDAFKNIDIKGVVTHIANSSEYSIYNSDHFSQYRVKIQIINHPEKLRPGMSASVSIQTDKKDNIITIPLQCINSNGCIFVVEESGNSFTVKERKVSTGIQNMNSIEIKSGLSVDEMVVSAPYEAINKRLSDNGKVHINRDKH